jgi:phage terminase large subunit
VIETPGDGVIIFQGMQDHTAESIKSLEGFKRAWVEEAQTLSARSLTCCARRSALRVGMWFGWNPRLKSRSGRRDAEAAKRSRPARSWSKANWSDNPWFPAELEQERQDCLRMKPDQYDHIWEGGYVTVAEGAYYAKQLAEAKARRAHRHVAADPLMEYRRSGTLAARATRRPSGLRSSSAARSGC